MGKSSPSMPPAPFIPNGYAAAPRSMREQWEPPKRVSSVWANIQSAILITGLAIIIYMLSTMGTTHAPPHATALVPRAESTKTIPSQGGSSDNGMGIIGPMLLYHYIMHSE